MRKWKKGPPSSFVHDMLEPVAVNAYESEKGVSARAEQTNKNATGGFQKVPGKTHPPPKSPQQPQHAVAPGRRAHPRWPTPAFAG